jgi:hypothetical protein
MVAFRQDEEDRLDWQILRDGSISAYRNSICLGEDVEWLRRNDYEVYPFDCSTWTSESAMHDDLAQRLSFPAYYGSNFDAFNDCIKNDLPVPDAGGITLILNRFDLFVAGAGATQWPSSKTGAQILLDILAGASRYYLLTGRRFMTLIQSDDPKLRMEKLGCSHLSWNRREWLNKSRGL